MDIVLYGKGRDEIIASDVRELCELADETHDEYALILTENEMRTVAESHADSLERNGRIEIMGGLVAKITEAFSVSPYFSQNDFADGLCRLISAFYHTKNDCEDLISDDELIEFMVRGFNEVCHGSLDHLIESELPILARRLIQGKKSEVTDENYAEEREYE